MPAPALTYTASFEVFLQEYATTLGILRAKPETEALRPAFEAFAETLLASQTQDARLLLAVLLGNTSVRARDEDLDEVTDLVLEAILAETRGSYGAPLYKHFAGEDRPSVFKRPILGKQLERVRAWPESLAQSSETLQALAAPTTAAIQKADEALTAREKAQEARTRFRAVGERKQLLDAFTALRDDLFDKLVSLAKGQQEPDPQAYARSFFSVRESRSKLETEARIAQLQTQQEEQRQALSEIEAELAQLSTELEARRQEEEAREKARLELAAAEQALAEAKRKANALNTRKRAGT